MIKPRTRNTKHFRKITRSLCLRTKSSAPILAVNKLYKLLRMLRRSSVRAVKEICAFNALLNGIKVKVVIKLRNKCMKAGLM